VSQGDPEGTGKYYKVPPMLGTPMGHGILKPEREGGTKGSKEEPLSDGEQHTGTRGKQDPREDGEKLCVRVKTPREEITKEERWPNDREPLTGDHRNTSKHQSGGGYIVS